MEKTTIKSTKKNEIDMLNGPLFKKLIAVALPLAAISILQQLFNAADVAVVGRFASGNSLAAVGANTPIVNVFLTLFTGLATGSNVAISTHIGANKKENISAAVRTSFSLSLICAVLVVIVGQILAKPLLIMVNTPEEVLDLAVVYLRIYFFAMMFAVIYNFASAILRSKGDTKRPLYCLVASGILNIILNLVFVIIFHLDVVGVAIATLISNIVCAGITVLILVKEEEPFKINLKNLKIDKSNLLYVLRIGLPAGIQGMLFSISNIIIQSGINSFGTDCISGNTAAMNYEFMAYFIINAFSQTTTTFVSQNYGANNYKRCRKIFWMTLFMGMAGTAILSCCFYFGAGFWLRFFTTSEEVIAFAMVRMKWVVLLELLTGTYEISAGAMRGMGVSLLPSIITFMGTFVFRIIWVNTAFKIYNSITGLLIVYPISWVLIGITMMIAYFIIRKKKMPMTTAAD